MLLCRVAHQSLHATVVFVHLFLAADLYVVRAGELTWVGLWRLLYPHWPPAGLVRGDRNPMHDYSKNSAPGSRARCILFQSRYSIVSMYGVLPPPLRLL